MFASADPEARGISCFHLLVLAAAVDDEQGGRVFREVRQLLTGTIRPAV